MVDTNRIRAEGDPASSIQEPNWAQIISFSGRSSRELMDVIDGIAPGPENATVINISTIIIPVNSELAIRAGQTIKLARSGLFPIIVI